MAFLEQLKISERVMPFLAIVEADLGTLFKTRITYGWLIVGIFLQVIRVLSAPPIVGSSTIIVQGLSDFIFIWSMLIIGITASAVSSETGELADSIMSKSVKRYDYILAKFSSRVIYVMTIYGAITAVLVGMALRMMDNNHEVHELMVTILFVALVLIMLTVIGVTLSTLVSNTVISIISLLILWYAMVFIFPILDLGFLAPGDLMIQLEDVLQGDWSGEEWKTSAVYSSITIISIVLSTVYFNMKDL
ncbi:MAG: ABC transporter permease [Candidatus Thorarchaeota archaeon]